MPKKKPEPPKLKLTFSGMSIVLVANELNLSIFRPVWMCKLNILKPEEITEGSFISPAAIQIPAPNFHLAILPNRLQLSLPTAEKAVCGPLVDRVLGGILKALPHTPMSAMGVNFDFLLHPIDPTQFSKWNKAMFASPLVNTLCKDAKLQPRFGAYFSMFFDDMRLKVDVKPVRNAEESLTYERTSDPKFEAMKFNFNYHLDLNHEDPTGHALAHLDKWKSAIDHAQLILESLLTE